ncbi:MAG: hypothetical protein IKC37_02645, partial [Clostridia bacterium]|nr:hypothetical protein [Clostridia bacterium]
SEYEYAVSYVLEHYHGHYIFSTYDNGDFDITNNYSEEKYSKVGNTYNMKLSASYASSYSSSIYVGDGTVEASYGENGVESYISSYTETDCINTYSTTNSIQVRYSSNVQTIASPFDGFTLNNSLDYRDARA